jgi:predicted AlkP superfamily phosphohydrolase/phosphomutase
MTAKIVLLIGLDAARPALLKEWGRDGTLPNIGRFLAEGLTVNTLNNEGLEGSTWPSFALSLNPASHGFYWQEQVIPGTYRLQRCTPADFTSRKLLWEFLSDAGKRIVLLDVPIVRPAKNLRGLERTEWGGHDHLYGFRTSPPGHRDVVLERAGPYPLQGHCDVKERSVSGCRELADRLIRGTELSTRLAVETLAGEPWDFAAQVFGESHCAGHQLWHFHDPEHPGFDAGETARTGNLIREVYTALDRAVGALLARTTPETTVVLLTLHGMRVPWGASILLSPILERMGLLELTAAASPEAPSTAEPASALRSMYRRLPSGVRRQIYAVRQRVNQDLLHRGTPLPIVPGRSRCFEIHLGRGHSGIRLNLAGREEQGIVGSRGEADQLVDLLIQHLGEFVHAGTGLPLVRKVFRSEERFRGRFAAQLPDLIIEWNAENLLGTTVSGGGKGARVKVTSPRYGPFEGVNTYCRSGDHQLEGMFVVRGPGIGAGTLGRTFPTVDLAPTLALMLGAEMPGVEGRPIPELVSSPPGEPAG